MRQRRISYGWVVVGAGALITCVGMGALFSLGIFLKPIEESMRWSRTGISGIAFVNWIAMGLGSFVWGMLSDRYGARVVALIGGALLGLGLVLSSQVTALWQLYVTFGVTVGFAVGAFYAPLTATATRWFVANRGLAVALVSGGIGIGVLTISPLVRWLSTVADWRFAMIVVGDLAWLVIVPAALFVREPDSAEVAAEATAAGVATYDRDLSGAEVARSPQFWAIALTHFACCAAHSGPIFHMVTHAIDQGLATMVAATVLSVSGLASLGGRVATGLLADRFGAKRTLVVGLALQAAMISLYLLAHSAAAFYSLALFFGIAYGGVMPLYALLVREYFGEKVMGTAYGGVFLVSTLGMGLGSFAGGWVYDALGSYGWLFVSSAAIGGAAILVALTFRAPRPGPVLVPVAGGR
jgi:MFS family permease